MLQIWNMICTGLLLQDAHTCLYLFSNSIDLLSLIYFYMRSMIIRLSMSSVRQPMSRLLSSTATEFDHHHSETRWCWLRNCLISIGRWMAEYFMHIKSYNTTYPLPRRIAETSKYKIALYNRNRVKQKEVEKMKYIWIKLSLRLANKHYSHVTA